MKRKDYKALARILHLAETERMEVDRITLQHPELDVDSAYRIQEELTAIKLEQGNRLIGRKMGLTSVAKMKQMNVDQPIYGQLFDYMAVNDDGVLSINDFIHPRVEAEIAFILGEDIEGPGVTGAQVLRATQYVLPSLEIIDSRYRNFQFTLPDVIADNASSARFVLGSKLTVPEHIDLDLVGVILKVNGEIKGLGTGAAVLNHPARSVAMLANMLAQRGEKLEAGEVVLTGGITAAVALHFGDVVTAEFDQLGDVGFLMTGNDEKGKR
jgi:2-oxo-3-hexenedioate decarboxylase